MRIWCILALGGLVGSAFAQPVNDMFADAEEVSGSLVQVDGTTVDATREAGEEVGSDDQKTIWYRWVAPRKGDLKVSTSLPDSSKISTYIYQLVGPASLINLTRIAYDYSGASSPSGFNFQPIRVVGGGIYYFRLGTNAVTASSTTLILSFAPVYESAVRISTAGTIKKRKTIRGLVSTPEDVASIRVSSSRWVRATKVRYNSSTGSFKFKAVRKGKQKRGKSKRVRFTVQAMRGGTVIGSASKTFKVRW